MTVIAMLGDLGLAFSDVMLSHDTPGRHFISPSTGDTSHLEKPLGLSPTRLVRKFFRLSYGKATGVFLVAGTVSHIQHLLDNLEKVKNNSDELSPEYLRQLNVDEPSSVIHVACLITEEEGFKDFEIIGILNGEPFARRFDGSVALKDVPYFGKTILAGGGANDLFSWLHERGEFYVKQTFADEAILEKGLRALNTIPSLLLEEDTRESLRTISKGVGGYYEAYCFNGNTLEPTDSLLTVFAALKGDSSRPYIELRRLFFHCYIDDWLLVISLFGLPEIIYLGEKTHIPLARFEFFPIPPIFSPPDQPMASAVTLAEKLSSAERFSLSLYREESHGSLIKRFGFGDSGPARRLFNVSIDNGNLVLELKQEDFDYFLEQFPDGGSESGILTLN